MSSIAEEINKKTGGNAQNIAEAIAQSNLLSAKLDIFQGTENANSFMLVNSEGNVVPVSMMIDFNMTEERTTGAELFDQVLAAYENHTIPMLRMPGNDCMSYYMPTYITFFPDETPRKFSVVIHSPLCDIELWAIENSTERVSMDVFEGVNRKKIREGSAPEAAAFAPVYSTTSTYSVGDLVWNDGLYKCKTAITSAEAWTAAHWQKTTITDEFTRKTEQGD